MVLYETLDDQISVTIIATGFDAEHKQKDPTIPVDVRIHDLYKQEATTPKVEKRIIAPEPETPPVAEFHEEIRYIPSEPEPLTFDPVPATEQTELARTVEFTFEPQEAEPKPDAAETLVHEFEPAGMVEEQVPQMAYTPQPVTPPQQPVEHDYSDFNRKANERVSKLRALSEKLKSHQPIEASLYELESVPAYKRRNIELTDVAASSESQAARLTLSENPDKSLELRSENSFLHKTVD